jgi:hypothetical protein
MCLEETSLVYWPGPFNPNQVGQKTRVNTEKRAGGCTQLLARKLKEIPPLKRTIQVQPIIVSPKRIKYRQLNL